MSTLLRDLNELAAYYAPWAWFPVVWAVSLIAVCAVGAYIRTTVPSHASEVTTPVADPLRPTPALLVAGCAFAAFLCAYVTLVFYHEELVGQDFSLITGGRFATVLIWPHAGRFIPLAVQEYNLLSLIYTSAALFHAWTIVQLVIVLACVYNLLDTTPAWFRFSAMMFLMSMTSVVHSFFGLIFTERDLVFWLAVWLVCMRSFGRTNSRVAFCGALFAAQCALYYKETAFVFIGGVAGSQLLLGGWRDAALLKQRHLARFVGSHAVDIANLGLCAVFLLTYLVAIAPHVTTAYAGNAGTVGASIAVLKTNLRSNLLLVALAVAFLWRTGTLVARKERPDPFWEPLAAGALAFALAYIKLGIAREYYLAPVDLVAVLYLGRLGYGGLRAGPRLAIAAAVLFLGWTLQRNVTDAAYFVLSRKEYVAGRVRLEAFLRDFARSNNRAELTLFFPQAGGFDVMEFAAFLRTRGWRPTHEPARDSTATTFVIKSAHRYPGDICYPSHGFRCEYAPTPQKNDLVVLFPGRHVSEGELQQRRVESEEVLHYRAQPTAVERALRVLVSEVRMIDRPADGWVFKY